MEYLGCLTGRVSPANGDLVPLGDGDPVALSVKGACEITGGKISSKGGVVIYCSVDGREVAQDDPRCMKRTVVGAKVVNNVST